MKLPKEFKALVRTAKKQGWDVVQKTNGLQFRAPDGEGMVTIHGTPNGGKRGVKNAEADLKRAGLRI